MISIKNLTKRNGRAVALRNVTFAVDGENLAVLGDKESGKGTLVKILCGMLSPDLGSATACGHRLTSREAAEMIGYMPDKCVLAPALTLAESMEYAARLRGLDDGAVDKALEEADMLSELADVPVAVLGDAAQKRASLAFALLGSPRYLVLDHPVSGLDEDDEAEMIELLQELSEEYTLIYLSDTVDDARAVCDSVMLLSGGKNVAFDSFDAVISPNYEIPEYKARTRGDAGALRAALSESEIVKKYQVSITASGTAIIELTLNPSENVEKALRAILTEAGQRVIELKRADSPVEKVLSRLYANQDAKEDARRERRAEKAEPVKITKELVEHSLADDVEVDEMPDDVATSEDNGENAVNSEKTEKKTAFDDALLQILSVRDRAGADEEAEAKDEDGDSTLF